MTCWHTSFTRMKENKKIDEKKKGDLKKWSSLWANHQNLQIKMGKTWKTINIDF